jgi:ABC-2 type transport system permease protein
MKNNLIKTLLIILGILALNIGANYLFFRADLTEEKRYSISDATKNLLQNLEDDVYVKVYLDGDDLPGGFVRLKNAVEETLDEFKIYGGNKINYEFVNINAISDPQKRQELQVELEKKGLQPNNIVDKVAGKRIETLIYPYCITSIGKKEKAVLLLNGNQTQSPQEKLNQSYENVEYEIATSIRQLGLKEKKKIGLLTDFTKTQPKQFAGLITSLQARYDLYIINSKQSSTFVGLDALILPKPDLPIDDSTKFKIDQYVMNGGNALFFYDALKVDSVSLEGNYAQPLKINLDDLFFKYGIRINENMVKDGESCATIPLVVGAIGDKPNIELIPYRYYPLINNFGKSLITKNINLVWTRFVASIDTIKSSGIRKTPLLMTTSHTKVLNAPAFVTYNEARTETDTEEYNAGIKVIAYLLDGQFTSLYKNRLLPTDPRSKDFKSETTDAKVIICSDGDLIVNDIDNRSGNPLPLGYDKYSRFTFGNRDFVLNAIDYLVDENGVIAARGKDVKIRQLDSLRVRDERKKWQNLNLFLPMGLAAIFLGFRQWMRKRRYAG